MAKEEWKTNFLNKKKSEANWRLLCKIGSIFINYIFWQTICDILQPLDTNIGPNYNLSNFASLKYYLFGPIFISKYNVTEVW